MFWNIFICVQSIQYFMWIMKEGKKGNKEHSHESISNCLQYIDHYCFIIIFVSDFLYKKGKTEMSFDVVAMIEFFVSFSLFFCIEKMCGWHMHTRILRKKRRRRLCLCFIIMNIFGEIWVSLWVSHAHVFAFLIIIMNVWEKQRRKDRTKCYL